MTESMCVAGHPWSALVGSCQTPACAEPRDQTGEPPCAVCGWISAGHTCCPPMRACDHHSDEHCTVVDDECTGCGVYHGDPCATCGGRGFHVEGCKEIEAL